MVSYTEILSSNSSFFYTYTSANLTAVFFGATNGIGLGALRALLKHTSGTSPTLYIVGRSPQNLESLTTTLSALCPSANLIPIPCEDLTLIQNAKTAANKIAELIGEGKLDLLIMSPGYRSRTLDASPEGLDRVGTIEYYARMCFLLTLAPLLRRSASPRVVTVLGGKAGNLWFEDWTPETRYRSEARRLWFEDWTLENHYSAAKSRGAHSTMTTLFLEEFGKQPGNEKIGLVHLHPGIVGGTGLKAKGTLRSARVVIDCVVRPLRRVFGRTAEEAGERVLYAATSRRFTVTVQRCSLNARASPQGPI